MDQAAQFTQVGLILSAAVAAVGVSLLAWLWNTRRERSREVPLSPADTRYFVRQDARRLLVGLVMLTIGILIAFGVSLSPGVPGRPNLVFVATWLTVMILVLVLVGLACVDWISGRIATRRQIRELERQRRAIVRDFQKEQRSDARSSPTMPFASDHDQVDGANGNGHPRAGSTVVEVVIVAALGLLVLFSILLMLPRGRERSRLLACQSNLRQLGVALAQYSQNFQRLPSVPPLGAESHSTTTMGVLPTLIATIDPGDTTTTARFLPLMVCPSDPATRQVPFPAPISYRLITGDQPQGGTGTFAPGKTWRLEEIEADDGLAYTAALTERLIGRGTQVVDDRTSPRPYAIVQGPVSSQGCPPNSLDTTRHDAGWSWAETTWRSTLVNLLRPPNAIGSCIAQDQRTASIGASSGHTDQIHVLMLDMSVKSYTPRVDGGVWSSLGRIGDGGAATTQETTPRSEPAPPVKPGVVP